MEVTRSKHRLYCRRLFSRDDASRRLRGALWDEQHFGTTSKEQQRRSTDSGSTSGLIGKAPAKPTAFYPDIDLSIPDTVYADDGSIDLVWDLLRWEAHQNQQQQYEPLLVSFLHSSILNHNSLESSLAFLLANRLQSPAMMISTQLQNLIFEALQGCPVFRRNLRADIMAVRDRDPACNSLPDAFLYFKGFHALQSHRVAHILWNSGRQVLAQYLQSQVSQIFQIDIHPNATLGSGIMLVRLMEMAPFML
jgi:serine O-acetyltransferase